MTTGSSSAVFNVYFRPWNCVGQAPVNDKDDPYLAEDGQLVFAVPRAPVDGGPCLVSY